jgi:hypothetical protein
MASAIAKWCWATLLESGGDKQGNLGLYQLLEPAARWFSDE